MSKQNETWNAVLLFRGLKLNLPYKEMDLQQNSEEWIQYRRTRIGASESSAVLGKNPWKTAYQLYQDKISGDTKAPNPAMMRGSRMEPEAREFIRNAYNCDWKPAVLESLEYPFMFASLDGWCVGMEYPIVEIKCGGEKLHLNTIMGVLDDHYMIQCQKQMLVAGETIMLFVSYQDPENVSEIVVYKDQNIWDEIIEKEKAFYDHHLSKMIPPEQGEKDAFNLDDHEALDLCEKLVEIKKVLKEYKALEQDIEGKIIPLLTAKKTRCGSLEITRSARKGVVDFTQIPQLAGIDLEAYRKPSTEAWRFTVKE